MRRAYVCWGLVLVMASALQAQKRGKDPTAGFPRALLSARFVYVTSMTGGEFNISTDPEDRSAIDTVQDALQKWGRYTLVYKPEDADLIFNVRAGRLVEALAGVTAGTAQPPGGTGMPASVGGMVGAGVGPPDDYVEILMPIPTERLNVSRATPLWKRAHHNGFGDGAPLIQEFRKEADAAAAHDAQAKKKPSVQ
jgi:hypothetical protein